MCLSSGKERGDVTAELDALGELPLSFSWRASTHFSEGHFNPGAYQEIVNLDMGRVPQ